MDFEAYAREAAPGLLRFAFLVTGDAYHAEDLVQEALTRTHRRWASVEHPDAYVRAAVLRGHLSWRRRRASHEVVGTVPERPDPVDAHAVVERDAVWRVLATLPRRQRAVLVLRYYEDLPDDDIAGLLGCAPGTVRSLATRAFAALRADPAVSVVRDGSVEDR